MIARCSGEATVDRRQFSVGPLLRYEKQTAIITADRTKQGLVGGNLHQRQDSNSNKVLRRKWKIMRPPLLERFEENKQLVE